MSAGEKESRNTKIGGKRPGSGRPRGSRNKSKIEAEAAARLVVEDPAYRKTLIDRARACELPPAVETMLWHYAHGKPVERHEISGVIGIAELVAGAPKVEKPGV
jgi:hypothetical protein